MSPSKPPVYAFILSGGQSSRLFPFNKVLSDLTGSGSTLLQQAHSRAVRLAGRKNVRVITVPDMVPKMRRQILLPKACFLSDPARRGTWPAILWAMAHLRSRKDADPIIAVLTADHVMNDARAFLHLASKAIALASKPSSLVLLGVKPSKDPNAWLGFGCFRLGVGGTVQRFEEKPAKAKALSLIKEGRWLWNSGMFFFRTTAAEDAMKLYQPEQYRVYQRIVAALRLNQTAAAARAYQNFPAQIPHPLQPDRRVDNTIDYAIVAPLVAARTPAVSVLAMKKPVAPWSDIGRWDAIREIQKSDRRGNICLGRVAMGKGVRQCILAADKGWRLNICHVENAVVAISGGKALMLSLDRLSAIKEIVGLAKGPIVIDGLTGVQVRRRGNTFVVSGRANLLRSAS